MSQHLDNSRTESLTKNFEPELVARFWQHNAMRLMRANERLLHGFIKAATREIELAQDLMQYNLQRFQKLSRTAENEQGLKAGPAMARATTNGMDENFKKFEDIVAGMREVSEEMWKTFGDASRLLVEGTLTETKDTMQYAAKQGEAGVNKLAEAAKD